MEHAIGGLALVTVLGIAAQWLAWRFRLPSILILLLFGFAAGPLTGLLAPDLLLGPSLMPFVALAVALILFEGGLSLRLGELPRIGGTIRNLVTAGALITFIAASAASWWIFGLDLSLAVLFGSILVVTGPTVVFPLLRHIRPTGRVGAVLRWEGIVIDPVGATLALLVFEVLLARGGLAVMSAIVEVLLKTVFLGVTLGLAGGVALVFLLKRYWIPEYLDSPTALAVIWGVFALSDYLQEESGFLTVTVMGIYLANQKVVSISHIVAFKENLKVIFLGALFILLSARIDAGSLAAVDPWRAGLFLLILVVLVRPLAVAVSAGGSGLDWRELTFLSVMAPRGIVAAAVASIFSLRLEEAGFPNAFVLVPLTFLVIVGTILVYGLGAPWVARRLGLSRPNPNGVLLVGAQDWAIQIGRLLKTLGVRVVLVDSNPAHVTQARMAGLDAYLGDVLSNRTLEELDLDGIGAALALTSNNEVNSLCSLQFAEVFGRNSVYQLPFGNGAGTGEAPPPHLHRRFLFRPELDFQTLERHFQKGGRLRTLTLEAAPDKAGEKSLAEGSVMPLFVLRRTGQFQPMATDDPMDFGRGDTLVVLSGAEVESADRDADAEAV
ncbi:MAG: sodium:proton antiporter [Acidobacteriota bacterium]